MADLLDDGCGVVSRQCKLFRDLLYALQHSTNRKTLQVWITSLIIIALSSGNEAQFFFTGNNTDYLFVSLFVGLTVGGAVWPLMSDTLGRKQIFTSTIVLMGMGGLVGAGMPSFTKL